MSTRMEEGQKWLTAETLAGVVLEIVRPEMSEQLEAELMQQGRAIV